MGDGDDEGGHLTIGELSERTGVRPTTLRMWESRYGFPRPERLDSGHRRYAAGDVDRVAEVIRQRGTGIRLDAAIDRAMRDGENPPTRWGTSIYAELRRRHPGLSPHRLRKTTLRGLSWAIEDEIRASVSSGHLFAAFQQQRFFDAARTRWLELGGFAEAAFVFADFASSGVDHGLTAVPLGVDAPLRNEWAVVCDSPEFSVALSAWELPRQGPVRDRKRVFESMWTIDPEAVRDAARVCAHVAELAGAPGAPAVSAQLAAPARPASHDAAAAGAATALYNRVVAYIDRESG